MKWQIGDYVECVHHFGAIEGYAPVGYRGYLQVVPSIEGQDEMFCVSGYPLGNYNLTHFDTPSNMRMWFNQIKSVDDMPIVDYPSIEEGLEV